MRTGVYTYADVLNETLTFDVTDCDTVGIFTLNDLNTLTPVNKKFEIKRQCSETKSYSYHMAK